MTKLDISPDFEKTAYLDREAAAKSYALTALGWLVVKAVDEVRLQRIEENLGRYPTEIREHLSSRYNRDGTITLSQVECEETLGPFLGPGMPPLIEAEIEPARPRVIASTLVGSMLQNELDL